MLALVTCHIFPPQSDTEKKWIPGTWLPGWQLAVFQSPRLHECGPADAHGNAQPFCTWTNVSSGKNACFAIWPHVGTKFFNLSQHFLSMDGWPGDAIFFLWGQPLKIIHENSAKKRSSPLDFIFDTCASASSSHLLLVGEAEHMWLYPFCKDKCIFRKKRLFCNLGALTQNSRIRPIMSVKKRSSPLDFIFDTCASASSSHFFGWWSWTCVSVPFCKDNCIFSKKTMCFAIWARVDTKFLNSAHHVLSVDDWPGDATFSCGPTFEDHPQVFSQKRSSPLDFIFDPCAFASWSHFFGWWRWTYVVVPLLQSHLKNHTHSINHGTFFPGVWHLDMF